MSLRDDSKDKLKSMIKGYCEWNHPQSIKPGELKGCLENMKKSEAMRILLLQHIPLGTSKSNGQYGHTPLCDMICKGDTELVKVVFAYLNPGDCVQLLSVCRFMPLHMAGAVYWRNSKTVKTIISLLTPEQQCQILNTWEDSEFTRADDKVSYKGYQELVKLVKKMKERAVEMTRVKKAENELQKLNQIARDNKYKLVQKDGEIKQLMKTAKKRDEEIRKLRESTDRRLREKDEEIKQLREDTHRQFLEKDHEIRLLKEMLESMKIKQNESPRHA